MADINLNHAPIDQAADELTQAGTQMQQAMDDCLQALNTAMQQLQGDTANATEAFRTALSGNEAAMADDISKGADILRSMHDTLRTADSRAAASIN